MISMAIFNSKLFVYQRVNPYSWNDGLPAKHFSQAPRLEAQVQHAVRGPAGRAIEGLRLLLKASAA